MRLACILVIALLAASVAEGHDARPLVVTIIEQASGVYRVVVRLPPTLESSNAPQVIWPAECGALETNAEAFGLRDASDIRHIACPGGLAGLPVRIEYPLYNPSLSSLFRLETASGMSITAVLAPDEDRWIVPEEPTLTTVAFDYTTMGFEHIWAGPDHLLFVAGLLLLAAGWRRILWAITGFTAAHSITLSAAALGFVRVPVEPTEAMIALSILVLAAEIARRNPNSFSQQYPVALSFGFGLLHGFGFASALGEIGLPGNELIAGLLFFNFGVELGQVAFIAAAAVAVAVYRLIFAALKPVTRPEPSLRLVGAYALGIPAAFWFMERTALALQA